MNLLPRPVSYVDGGRLCEYRGWETVLVDGPPGGYRLLSSDDGVLIEDLDSTNGSFLNDRRMKREKARIGDEIGFDKLRFRLVGAGGHEPVHIEATKAVAAASSSGKWLWGGLVVAVGAALATIALQ